MSDLASLGSIGVIVTLLAGITHEVSEQLFGGILKGKYMYWASLGVGVVVTVGAQAIAPQFEPMAPLIGLPLQMIIAGGVIVGFVATKLHKVLQAEPGTHDSSLSGMVKSVASAAVEKITPKSIGMSEADVLENTRLVALGDLPAATDGDKFNAGYAKLNLIVNDYKTGKVSRDATLQAVEFCKTKYPGVMVPPGFPAEPQ